MRRLLPLAFLLVPGAAFAHAGIGAHGGPLASGLLHPMLGPDHLLTMVSVGLLAAMTGGRGVWAYPASFVGGMVVGGFLGFEGTALPILEPTILASVVVLGVAVAFALRPPLPLACTVIALFGIAHGYAHGLEGPGLGGLAYATGFVISTTLLHLAGLGLGFAAGSLNRQSLARGLGALTAVAGVALFAA